MTTRLKWNGSVQGVPPVPRAFTNSYGLGTRWLNTGRYGGCGNWQAVVTGTVIDSAGRPTTAQATTYAPVSACGWARHPRSLGLAAPAARPLYCRI